MESVMKFIVEVELSEREAEYLCHTSIERGIDQTIEVVKTSTHAEAHMVQSELKAAKAIIVNLWSAAHNAVFAGNKSELLQLPLKNVAYVQSFYLHGSGDIWRLVPNTDKKPDDTVLVRNTHGAKRWVHWDTKVAVVK